MIVWYEELKVGSRLWRSDGVISIKEDHCSELVKLDRNCLCIRVVLLRKKCDPH